jgi:hypothetical protein
MSKFNSDKTFVNEFKWLLQNLPEALDLKENNHISDIISNHFQGIENIEVDNSIEVFAVNSDYFENIFEESILFISESRNPGTLNFYAEESHFEGWLIEELIHQMGNEAFGFYLPMHKFFANKHNNWGIYLFPELIVSQAKRLQQKFNSKISIDSCIRLYGYCIYRHELFHYHTELFATAQEVLIRKPFYLNYSKNIYTKYAQTEDWLEEALAEASVLNSRLVSSRSVVNSKLLKLIYEHDLKNMPPGYRDYRCSNYGGSKIAHQFLASQIIHGENYRPTTTQLHTVKSSFISKDKNVPVYFVKALKAKRIQ